MTDLSNVPSATDSWDALLDNLRRRYPGQKDSVLFCIHKLQQNPDLTMRDFRAEAELHGIPLAGRSVHSARLLLGLIKTEPAGREPEPERAPERAPRRRARRSTDDEDAGGATTIESKVMAAVRQIQSAASAEAGELRAAMRQAIAILQRALGED